MTLKSNANFEEKLTLGSKNNIRNLMNYNASSGRSENLHFDVLLLSIAYKVLAKKYRRIIFHDTQKKIQNFDKKLTFCLKNDMRNLVNFTLSSGKSKICTLMSQFCRKYVMFELKRYRGVVP